MVWQAAKRLAPEAQRTDLDKIKSIHSQTPRIGADLHFYMAIWFDLRTLAFWETVDFPLDHLNVKLFAEGSTATKSLGGFFPPVRQENPGSAGFWRAPLRQDQVDLPIRWLPGSPKCAVHRGST